MMPILEALRSAELEALQRELGVTGMVRFLQMFEAGKGDYTAERWQWLPTGVGVDELAKMIQQKTSTAESRED